MKQYHYYVGGIVLVIALCLFYSCMHEKAQQDQADKTDWIEFNPEMAGIGHNKCLDIFYQKLHQLKLEKTRNNPSESLEYEQEELEDTMVESLVECLQGMEMEAGTKDETIRELNEIINYYDTNPNEEIEAPEWSEKARELTDRLQTIIDTDYLDATSAINDILVVENHAKQSLSESECNTILMCTAIMRHSMEYWHENFTGWPLSPTRSGGKWKDVVTADCDWALRAVGFGATFPGARYGVLKWVMRGLRVASWQAQLLLLTSVAAIGSIAEATVEETENEDIETEVYDDMELGLCYTVAEKAIRIYTAEASGQERGE